MRLADEKQLYPDDTPFTLAIQRVYLHEGEAYYVAGMVSLLEHPLGGSALMASPEEMARRVRECRKEMRRVMERHLGRRPAGA